VERRDPRRGAAHAAAHGAPVGHRCFGRLTNRCLDIETLAESRFTDNDPICMIAMRHAGRAAVLVVGAPVESPWVHATDWEVHYYLNEYELLRAVMRFIHEADPDFITGGLLFVGD